MIKKPYNTIPSLLILVVSHAVATFRHEKAVVSLTNSSFATVEPIELNYYFKFICKVILQNLLHHFAKLTTLLTGLTTENKYHHFCVM